LLTGASPFGTWGLSQLPAKDGLPTAATIAQAATVSNLFFMFIENLIENYN
jgi:hypothetical protein